MGLRTDAIYYKNCSTGLEGGLTYIFDYRRTMVNYTIPLAITVQEARILVSMLSLLLLHCHSESYMHFSLAWLCISASLLPVSYFQHSLYIFEACWVVCDSIKKKYIFFSNKKMSLYCFVFYLIITYFLYIRY